jgi:ketosteroid isomerase-like protein
MKRSLLFAPLLTVCLAMPAAAQQLSEQEVRPAIERLLEAWDAAADKKDAAGIATMYTEDAMRVTPRGFQYGRDAIEKGLEETFQGRQ